MSDLNDPVDAIRAMEIPPDMEASEALKAFLISAGEYARKDGEGGGANTDAGELLRLVIASHMEVLDVLGKSGINSG